VAAESPTAKQSAEMAKKALRKMARKDPVMVSTEERLAVMQYRKMLEAEAKRLVESGASEKEVVERASQLASLVASVEEHYNSRAGQTLQAVQMEKALAAYMDARLQRGGTLSPFEQALMAEMDMENPASVQKVAEILMSPGKKGAMLATSAMYTHLLSALAVPKAAMQNTFQLGYIPVERALEGAVDGVRAAFGKPRDIYATEALSLAMGYFEGMVPGMKKAAKAFFGMDIEDMRSSYDIMTHGVYNYWDTYLSTKLGKTGAASLCWSSRGLVALDLWARTVMEAGQRRALDTRFAAVEGMSPEARRAFETRFVAEEERHLGRNPLRPNTKRLEAAVEHNVKRRGLQVAFIEPPGHGTEALEKVRRAFNLGMDTGVGTLLMPFLQITSTVLSRSLEHVPVAGAVYGAGKYAGEKYKGASNFNRLAAAQITGGLATLALVNAMKQNRVRSPQSDDVEHRGMIQLGENWYRYEDVPPFGPVVGMVTSAMEGWEKLEVANAQERFAQAASTAARYLLHESAVGRFMEMTDAQAKTYEQVSYLAQGLLVPYSPFLRNSWRAWQAAETGQVARRRPASFLDVFGRGIPRYDYNGEPIMRESWKGMAGIFREWLPLKWQSAEPADAVEAELGRLGVYPTVPYSNLKVDIEGEVFKIPADLYVAFVEYGGPEVKRTLRHLVGRPVYERKPEEKKKKMLAEKVSAAWAPAKAKLKREIRKRVRTGEMAPEERSMLSFLL